MFIMPSFKKSLIVEQFQGNYLKFNTNLSPEIKKGFGCEVNLTVLLLLQKSDLDPCAGRP